MRAAILCIAFLLAAGHADAQSSGEISFWESVRDSKNPAELQAYIDQYPNGSFVVLAKSRLAALQKPVALPPQPAAPPQAAPVVAGPPHNLQEGDAWTYRLSYPRLRGQWGQAQRPPATYAITLSSAGDGSIVDLLSIDGGTTTKSSHTATPTLLREGAAAVFSPYLYAQGTSAPGRLRSITIDEPGCVRAFVCEAKGRISGSEVVQVPAGKFFATKVIVEQEWYGASVAGGSGGRLTGGRTLTIWYAAEIGRAVKYSSRLTVGDLTPMDGNFDLELVSYQLK